MNIIKKKKLSLIVFTAILLTSLWSASGTFDSSDAANRARVAHQLVTEGQLVVESVGDAKHFSTFQDQNGSYNSQWGIGQSVFFLPFVALSNIVTQNLPVEPTQKANISGFLVSVPVFWIGLAINFWLCLKLSALLRTDRFTAYILSFIATFGSGLWHMAKQGQEEIQLSILLLFSLYGFLYWKRSNDYKYVWLSAVSASATLIFRPTALPIFVGTVGLYIYEFMFEKRTARKKSFNYLRVIVAFGVATFCSLTIALGYNFFKTGNPLKSGVPLADFYGNWLNGIIEPIFGLDKGILWTNPWLLPCIIFTFLSWKYLKDDLKLLLKLSLFLFISSVAIYCKWFSWAGDFTYGARFQVHLVPLLCLTLGTATLTYIKRFLYKGQITKQYKLLSLLFGFTFVLLQIPSIAFIHSLEIYQALQSHADSKSNNGSPTGALGQVQLRYANFISKLTTGKTIEFAVVKPLKVTPNAVDDASRWNFWSWLAKKRLSQNVAKLLQIFWILIVLVSVFSWIYAFWILYQGK